MAVAARKKAAISQATAGEEIPPELKGARKWSTVKIADSTKPSHESIFIGDEQSVEVSCTTSFDYCYLLSIYC
jgi:hypothetical protein